MIRSSFPLTRVLFVPFILLLALYLLVVGGGSAWFLYQVRQTETEILTSRLNAALQPLAERLSGLNPLGLMETEDSWLREEISSLFTELPELREVSVRELTGGRGMHVSRDRGLTELQLEPLASDAPRASEDPPASQRLHGRPEALFILGFDLREPENALIRMDFGFKRAGLIDSVQEAIAPLVHATFLFGIVGAVCIAVAFGLSLWVGRSMRRIEAHYQELYGRNASAELMAAMVHDLRNPLMAVRTNLRALQITPEQSDAIVDEIDRDLVGLSERLSAFLDLTRRREEKPAKTDLTTLIREAGRLAEPALSRRGLKLVSELADDLPEVEAVSTDLRDALLNLLVNGAESGQTEGAVQVGARRVGDSVEIAVEDQGPGISPATHPRLFEAFFTTKQEGYGLGLAIVNRIVENHNGSIRAENRASGGARFVIRLPIRQKEAPSWWKQNPNNEQT